MDEELIPLLIPIFGIVFGVGIAVVAIIVGHREKLKRAELRHRERMAALEKGIELPAEPDLDADRQRTGSLKSGVMGILIGIVLYFALDRVADDDVALFGLIPAAVGAANLVAWIVEARRRKA
jgi:tetrahydromethanopterin S-methyltransferase subunit B